MMPDGRGQQFYIRIKIIIKIKIVDFFFDMKFWSETLKTDEMRCIPDRSQQKITIISEIFLNFRTKFHDEEKIGKFGKFCKFDSYVKLFPPAIGHVFPVKNILVNKKYCKMYRVTVKYYEFRYEVKKRDF